MLFIEIISSNAVRFGSTEVDSGEDRYLPTAMEARKDEWGLVWIWHKENHESYLNSYDYTNITLDGNTYSSAEDFVVAFNAAIGSLDVVTTTTTIPATTTTTTPPATTTTTTIPATTTTTTESPMLANLVSVWEFDETSGTTAVDSHGGYDGAITGGVTLNQAGATNITPEYQFDGVNGKVITTMPDGGYRNGNVFTFSLWIKPNFSATTGVDQMFSIANGTNSDDNEVTLRQNGTTQGLMLLIRSGGANVILTSQNLTNGVRYHIIVTCTATQARMYINNAEEANSPQAVSGSIVQVAGSKLVIGYVIGTSGSYYYNGNIDQVSNWTRELIPQERADLYNSGNGLAYTNW